MKWQDVKRRYLTDIPKGGIEAFSRGVPGKSTGFPGGTWKRLTGYPGGTWKFHWISRGVHENFTGYPGGTKHWWKKKFVKFKIHLPPLDTWAAEEEGKFEFVPEKYCIIWFVKCFNTNKA